MIYNINVPELLDFLRNHFDPNLTQTLQKEVVTHHIKWTKELLLPSILCYSMNFYDTSLTSKAHGIQEVRGLILLIYAKIPENLDFTGFPEFSIAFIFSKIMSNILPGPPLCRPICIDTQPVPFPELLLLGIDEADLLLVLLQSLPFAVVLGYTFKSIRQQRAVGDRVGVTVRI